MFKVISKFAKDHSGPVKFFGGFIIGVIPLVVVYLASLNTIAIPDDLTGDRLVKYLIEANQREVALHNLIMRIYVGGLASVALLYLFYYFFERREVFHIRRYFGDQDYLDFARDRTKVVSSLTPRDLTKPIFATSHSNMFSRPDCKESPFKEDVKTENERFYRQLAGLLKESSDGVVAHLLIYIGETKLPAELRKKWEKRASTELKSRQDILKEVFKSPNFKHKFLFSGLTRKFLTDYLVIEDHLFITIRKPETSDSPVSCIHIQHLETAEAFRYWLTELSSPKSADYVDNTRLEKLM